MTVRKRKLVWAHGALFLAAIVFYFLTGLTWVIANIGDCMAADPGPCRTAAEHTRLAMTVVALIGLIPLTIFGVSRPWIAVGALTALTLVVWLFT